MNENIGIKGNTEQQRRDAFLRLAKDYSLPSPSQTVMEVIRLCRREDSSLGEIASCIETDPALSAKIIGYANSAYLSSGIQVASVQKATVKLGMQNVVNLALGFSLLEKNTSGQCDRFDYPLYWKTSLAEGVAAREIAAKSGEFDANELFVCGLLAHIGNLALATIFPQEYGRLLQNAPANKPIQKDEIALFGIDSAELTSELFFSWGMPASYALATGFHEELDHVELGEGRTKRGAIILYMAHQIALMCQSEEPLLELLEAVIDTAAEFSIDIGEFSKIYRKVVAGWHEYGALFEISTGKCFSYEEESEGE